jgi:integral membrane sensor domain MASE1
VGATAFAMWLGSGPLASAGYGFIEVIACGAAAFFVSRMTTLPARLDSARELAAIVLGGALPLALIGGGLATFWHLADGGTTGASTFRIWALSSFIGTLLVAPMVIAWSGMRAKRSGGMPMPVFVAGAVTAALFLGVMWLLFDRPVEQRIFGSAGPTLTYIPIVFMALVGLLWGARGATVVAFFGALIAMVNTAQGEGPFAGVAGFTGDPELEVEAYALAIGLTGLLIAVLAAAQRNAVRTAREWKTRFEATIGAHRLLAYEWDPVSGRFIVTGDSVQLLGRTSAQLSTLADWLAMVAPGDRDRVTAHFETRAGGALDDDVLNYTLAGVDGQVISATDDARPIRDHDGSLHRIAGIVRTASMARTAA